MAKNIVTTDVTKFDRREDKLQFLDFTEDMLLEKLIMLVNSMGIEKESYPTINKEGFEPTKPSFYLVAVLRRFHAMQKESKFNLLTNGVMKYKKHKKSKNNIMSKIEENVKRENEDKKKLDSMFSKDSNGIYMPVMATSSTTLKEYFDRMQPVYVVGGSVYSFGRGGSTVSSTPEAQQTTSNRVTKQIAVNKL